MIKKATLCTLSLAVALTGADNAEARRHRAESTASAPLNLGVRAAEPEETNQTVSEKTSAVAAEAASTPVVEEVSAPVSDTTSTPSSDPSGESQEDLVVGTNVQGLPVVNMETLPINYSVADQVERGVSKVELYVTTDEGKSWKLYGQDSDLIPPINFDVPEDGVYGFYTVATDKVGNVEQQPVAGTRPHVTVVVDTTQPVVTITKPAKGDVFNGTDIRTITWDAKDANFGANPISILASLDGATWKSIAQNIEDSGTFRWKPQMSAQSYEGARIRIVAQDLAGNVFQVSSDTFGIDVTPPDSRVVMPKVVGEMKFKVPFEAIDKGGAGMAEVELWYKKSDGRWIRFGSTTDMETPFEFESTFEGFVQFATVAIDKVGNRQEAPMRRKDVGRTIRTVGIDVAAPEVTLLTFNLGGVYQGGSVNEIKWLATDSNLGETPIKIEFSADGGNTWAVSHKALTNEGVTRWTIPNIDTHQARIKVTAIDMMGHAKSVESQINFIIDSTAPESRAIFSPGVSRPKVRHDIAPPAGSKSSAQDASTQAPQAEVPAATKTAQPVVTEAVSAGVTTKQPDLARFAEFDRYFTQGNFAGCDQQIKILKNRYSEDAGTWERAGDLELKRNDNEGALASFTKAIEIDPERASAKTKRAHIYYNMKQYDKGIQDFKEVLGQKGDDAEILINIGVMYVRLEQYEEAEAYLKKGVLIGGSSGLASYYLARVYEKKGEWGKAVTHWEEAARLYGPESDTGKLALKKKMKALKEIQ